MRPSRMPWRPSRPSTTLKQLVMLGLLTGCVGLPAARGAATEREAVHIVHSTLIVSTVLVAFLIGLLLYQFSQRRSPPMFGRFEPWGRAAKRQPGGTATPPPLDPAKSKYLSKITHELHTPLVAMQHALALLNDGVAGPLSAEQREYVAITIRNLERLKGLIGDLLDSSKPDAKPPPLEPPGDQSGTESA